MSWPSGSLELDVNVTGSPGLGGAGATPNAAVGARLLIVTECETVAVPPSSSVTLSATVKVPGEANERDAVFPVPSSNLPSLFVSHACDAIVPSGSLEVDVSVTFWPGEVGFGEISKAAVGARFVTVTVCCSVELSPLSSVTFSPTVYVPAFANEREALAPVASSYWPSLSRSHACDAIVPSGSLDEEVNVTVEPVGSGFGAAPKAVVGARLPIEICFVNVVESPLSSVAFSPTV